MYHATEFLRDQITDLCALVHSACVDGQVTCPPIMGLHKSMVVTLTYLRRNRVQTELSETCGVSQPTISRAISAMTPLLEAALSVYVPPVDELNPKTQYIVDGPVDGRRHDNHCLKGSGVMLTMDPSSWLGDKGYVGNDMITPIKKPAGRGLLDWEKEFNKQVNKIRYMIERTIANFKTWRSMYTDYRRPLDTFAQTISAVIGLHFYQLAG